MKITIDTQKDSKEDIKRAIFFLSEFVNSSNDGYKVNNGVDSNNSNTQAQPMMNMFGTSNDFVSSENISEKIEEGPKESEETYDETAKLIPY